MRSFASSFVVLGRRSVSFLGLVTLFAASCAEPASPDEVGALGAVQGALSGGGIEDDADSSEANVVVEIENAAGDVCSGTLLTPQIGVTAAHCVWGEEGDGGCYDHASPVGRVSIGARGGNKRPAFVGVALDAAAGCPQPNGS